MIRGEIWTVAGGVYSSKPCPAVILQDDRFDGTDAVTVCPLTSTDVSAPLMRLPLGADVLSGLDAASFVMVDKMTTVRRSNVSQRVGRLSARQLVDLERLVMVFLGLAD
ncbi:type II toxin-antitoxin system PemK/MazF family toxin [Cryobacterium sp. 1639]|uniref:type II toxin-antitoxin system PemK/MazF family toxin n=1 Tax=Cryobacterium inferilacus TaxID=2866629 RepID=UPI001C736F18|nr:type II toxin-antitoxin system PemK/MazF family toxin [Cryobacterium sp. 1639]MBX0300148.1 type II toxin-antitoxin system PemK/MazF family toxin [Cryobacterium sp. 1639]